MSGIVGIVNTDGSPVDRPLLRRLTKFMAFRGPDAQEVWADGPIGFGHALLRTTPESERERQPCGLDEALWITADARIDGREELVRKLGVEGCRRVKDLSDAELILHAYRVWGTNCLKHLLGDFSFAIWDAPRRRLFCARDHFGVKPFYYAWVNGTFLFGNTLDCLREHPSVSDRLNESALGDLLLFDYKQEPAATAFADIQRLPPAHFIICENSAPRPTRYWELPIAETIRYRRAEDYVEHGRELLFEAVRDRLPADQVGILMSGGLDSTSVAATACRLRAEGTTPTAVSAYTVTFDNLIPDQEGRYAGLTAETLGMRINYLWADGYQLYADRDSPVSHRPEPCHEPLGIIERDNIRQAVGDGVRVLLTGYGGDPAFATSPTHGIDLIRRGEFVQLAEDLGWFLFKRRQLPQVGFRGWLKRRFGAKPEPQAYPVWLNRDFEARLNLRERWGEVMEPHVLPLTPRPRAYQSLKNHFWTDRFECYDPGTSGVACEVRHPFFDLRLLTFLLSLPAVPWCISKELLRQVMHGILAEPVRLRPKTVLAGEPILEHARRREVQWIDEFLPTPELSAYVERSAIPRVNGAEDSQQLWINLRPMSLHLWLRGRVTQAGYTREEISYEFST